MSFQAAFLVSVAINVMLLEDPRLSMNRAVCVHIFLAD